MYIKEYIITTSRHLLHNFKSTSETTVKIWKPIQKEKPWATVIIIVTELENNHSEICVLIIQISKVHTILKELYLFRIYHLIEFVPHIHPFNKYNEHTLQKEEIQL